MISYNKVTEYIKFNQCISIQTEEDLDDMADVICEIKEYYELKRGVGILLDEYRSGGKHSIPTVLWFSEKPHLFSHQPLNEVTIAANKPAYNEKFISGVPPKAILDPEKHPQYWI